MKVPKRIKSGPFSLTTEDDPARLKDVSGDAALFTKECKLIYDGKQAPSYLRDSVLHECLHSAYQQTPLLDVSEEGNEREEKVVQAITPRLLDLLRDNPNLVRFLLEK